MGMRINTGSGIDPKLVDQLIEMERAPIKQIEARKKNVVEEQKLYGDVRGMVSSLGTILNGMRTRTDFFKLKLESSNPEIIEGTVENSAPIGSYETQVFQIAKTNKILTQSFPDKDKTPVGFGYMTVELDDGKKFEVDIDPEHATLQDVASQITNSKSGARAIVVKTNENLENPKEDNYRLLVISNKSGKEAKVSIDPDTTYLEMHDQVRGQNLHMLFEDVPIFNETNKVTELMPGVVLNIKKASPETKVTLKIDYDVDKTMESIKSFVDAYNKVNEFIDKQFQVDPQTNKAGILSKDNSLRALRRQLQNSLQFSVSNNNGKYHSLADVGITTDPKNGGLKLDDSKLKQALAEDYEEVSKLFIYGENSEGLGPRMSDAVRSLQNQQSGVFPSKEREFKRILSGFDKNIENRERYAAQRGESIKRRFAAVEEMISNMNSQGQALQQRLAAG